VQVGFKEVKKVVEITSLALIKSVTKACFVYFLSLVRLCIFSNLSEATFVHTAALLAWHDIFFLIRGIFMPSKINSACSGGRKIWVPAAE
jgi:hypothetical protein